MTLDSLTLSNSIGTLFLRRIRTAIDENRGQEYSAVNWASLTRTLRSLVVPAELLESRVSDVGPSDWWRTGARYQSYSLLLLA